MLNKARHIGVNLKTKTNMKKCQGLDGHEYKTDKDRLNQYKSMETRAIHDIELAEQSNDEQWKERRKTALSAIRHEIKRIVKKHERK